jgi:pimeloyl-ACP methyl ester carboxylesterase
MARFVLVHGSFHGAWCWEKVTPLLERTGHDAIAVDLPGHGADSTPSSQLSFASYVDSVCTVIAGQKQPVILVGHSMGGTIITGVAERIPDSIERLIYVCAFLPQNGQSLLDLAKTDSESELVPALVIDEPNGVHHVRHEGAINAFYHDCPSADAERARARLIKEPLAVVATPVESSAARFGRLPRDYILCTEDRALGPSLQRRMIEAQPCRARGLSSSHSPFYSMPRALVRLFLD